MKIRTALLASVLALSAARSFAQGPLAPPGAPAPTMKTLDQVEPRTPINETTAPGDATYHHIITQPGSYYLTGNLAVAAGMNGIAVRAAGVTIDLRGFEITRTFTGGYGILIEATAHRCAVHNGSISTAFLEGLSATTARGGRYVNVSVSGCSGVGIRAGPGWHVESCSAHGNLNGIFAYAGSTLINCRAYANSGGPFGISTAEGCTLFNCTAYLNVTTAGISAGAGSNLSHCTATLNTGTDAIIAYNGATLTHCTAFNNNCTHGIHALDGSTLTDCTSNRNTGEFGIVAGFGSTLTRCTARLNNSTAAASYGIFADDKCTVIACTSTDNLNTNATLSGLTGLGIFADHGSTVRDCTVVGNSGDGMRVASGASVANCTARENGFDGVRAAAECMIRGNNCSLNGTYTADGTGIRTTGAGNRIEENQAASNDLGFRVEGTNNVVLKNTARLNGTNYNLAADNRYGPVLNISAAGTAAVTGSSAVDTTTTTHPWANFAY